MNWRPKVSELLHGNRALWLLFIIGVVILLLILNDSRYIGRTAYYIKECRKDPNFDPEICSRVHFDDSVKIKESRYVIVSKPKAPFQLTE